MNNAIHSFSFWQKLDQDIEEVEVETLPCILLVLSCQSTSVPCSRELWYSIITKKPSHPSEMLLAPPFMKGKQGLSSNITLEQEN